MDLDDIKRGLRAEIKKRENEQYATFQCNVRRMCKDVLDKLEEQESEIAELKEERRWRKFSDETPEHHQWILVYYPNHSQFTTGVELRRWDEGCKYDVELQEIYDKWMPLPAAPKESDK